MAKQIAEGDQDAWRRLYDDSSDSLFNLPCYQTGDREAAKDLLQETCVTAMRAARRYRGEGSLHAWLRSVALRKSLDWRRSLARRARKHLAFGAQAPRAISEGLEPSFRSEMGNFQGIAPNLLGGSDSVPPKSIYHGGLGCSNSVFSSSAC